MVDPSGSETSLSPSMHVLHHLLMSWAPIAGVFWTHSYSINLKRGYNSLLATQPAPPPNPSSYVLPICATHDIITVAMKTLLKIWQC